MYTTSVRGLVRKGNLCQLIYKTSYSFIGLPVSTQKLMYKGGLEDNVIWFLKNCHHSALKDYSYHYLSLCNISQLP